MKHKPINQIAREIVKSWKKPYFGAIPYIKAMLTLDQVTDYYGMDTGESIVRYFLGNAQTWRGEDARRIKKQLNEIIK